MGNVFVCSQTSLLNTELVARIACGQVKVVDDVKCCTRSGVEFRDGTYEDIDVVVFATGYIIDFPFVEKEASTSLGPFPLSGH